VKPEPQEPLLFALAEPEPECILVLVPEPDLDPDPTENVIQKDLKLEATFLEQCCF
jgi:hypothetical protein